MIRLRLLVLVLAIGPTPLAAQHDYRNLDRGRPTPIEDAYPVEHRALEVMAPVSVEREHGETATMVEPEVMFGAVRNGMVGLGAPIALGADGGLAGLRPFAFYNFNTEMPRLPALALRIDVATPTGALGGEGVLATVTAIATRSFGVTRLHLNAFGTMGSALDAPLHDAPARWGASLGADHTLWRHSVALIAEVGIVEQLGGARQLRTGAGGRVQLTPTMVFDLGVVATGPAVAMTAGFTRSLGWLAGGVE